ncbi:10-hydroxy-9-(phosphonooxy)octadecanoate phosphatase [Aureococcus anophagefferens]|uniref:10-hydroxy-9-(Phosphonooxy)octadecanoate phosphatase n=1 Tax=Aureococcus anophagefferens TaxID=44056 RepID=A0ABR1FUP0_AURAN
MWQPSGCLVLLLATAALGGRIADDAAYVAAWATPGNVARCGDAGAADCGWLAGFGAIDVGCTFDVVLGLRANGTAPRPPTLVLTLASGEVVEIAAGDAAAADRFRRRPALCAYAKSPPSADVALLSVANSAAYLFRLWPLFLSRLLYASDSKLRPLVWIGELPKKLSTAERPACLASALARSARRRTLESFYDGDEKAIRHDATSVSNHYIKVPAALAALARPDTAGLFYVDLDAAAAWPWAATTASKKRRAFQRSVHDVNGSDVVFEHARGAFTTWWRVHGSRFYARDAPFARAFLRRWFGNRCSFKDQYSLWHSILEEADLGGCVRYGGELWRDLTYNEAKQTTPAELAARYPELALSCRSMEDACPRWRYCSEHGANPPLVDALAHASIPDRRAALRKFHYRDAAGTRKVLDVEAAVVVFENDRPTLGVLDAAPSTNGELLADLGIDARDVAVHPWW